MAGLSAPNIRSGITEILPEPLAAINPYVKYADMPQGELVRRLKAGKIVSEPLNGDYGTFFVPSRPYYWRFLVPSAEDFTQLETISFGIPDMRSRHFDSDDMAFEFEQDTIDDDIKNHLDIPKSEAAGCAPLIGDLALGISLSERPFFAGVERRYPLDENGRYGAGWSQLIFSSWLRHANPLFWKRTNDERYMFVPRKIWDPGPSPEKDIRNAARSVALAALFRTVPTE